MGSPCRSILFVGGCGYVGHLIAEQPHSYERWRHLGSFGLSTFDLRRCGVDCPCGAHARVVGGATNFGDLYYAAKGIDTLVYMAEGDVDRPETLFHATVYGFYTALMVARARGIRRVILLSSLSVFSRETGGLHDAEDLSEDAPPQCDHPDAITTLVAEWLGRYFAKTFGLSVIVLRLTGPKADDQVRAEREKYKGYGVGGMWSSTADSDVTEAILQAAFVHDVEFAGDAPFEVINIAGDLTGDRIDLSKAERILGWRPTV